MAPKSKLTKPIADKVVELIRGGMFPLSAAQALGIPPPTLYGWLARGQREDSGPYAELASRVAKAEAEHEKDILDVVVVQAKVDPKFALTYLGRRHASRWGRHDNVTVNTPETERESAESAKDKLATRVLAALASLRSDDQAPTPTEPAPQDE